MIRKSGREHEIYNVDDKNYATFRMDDGDVVTVDSVLDRYENRVEIRGAVYRAGLYQLGAEVFYRKAIDRQGRGVAWRCLPEPCRTG